MSGYFPSLCGSCVFLAWLLARKGVIRNVWLLPFTVRSLSLLSLVASEEGGDTQCLVTSLHCGVLCLLSLVASEEGGDTQCLVTSLTVRSWLFLAWLLVRKAVIRNVWLLPFTVGSLSLLSLVASEEGGDTQCLVTSLYCGVLVSS